MKKRTVKLRFKLMLLAAFLAYAAFLIFSQQANIGDLLAEQQTLNAQYDQAQMELQRLKDKSEYMNTKDYVEDTARKRLGYAYEDEIILATSDDGTN